MSKAPILLLGSYGRGNIGDDAFLLAALHLFDGHQLYINSANDDLLPKAVRGKVSTIATSGGKDLLYKLRVFRNIRHIVYCGGDLWVELQGERFPRQSLYKMVLVNTLARLFGKRVHYMGCGIGALHGYSLFLARLSASLAHGIVVREARSAKVLGLSKVRVLPDLVTTLGTRWQQAAHPKAKRQGKFVIGISLLYYVPNPQKNFTKLVNTLADVLGSMPSSHYRIVLFPMLASPGEEHDDVWASAQLQQKLPEADVHIFGGREVNDYANALVDVDILVGARLHANIIAVMAGTPVLGISYRQKVAQFFAMSGLSQYCLELDSLTPGTLTALLHTMRTDQASARRDVLAARERLIAEQKGYKHFVAAYF